MWRSMTLLGLCTAGCQIENAAHRAVQRDVFYQEPPADVDILWVVDDSQSMAQEQKKVGEQFAAFISHLESTNIVFHIGVVTTDMDVKNPDQATMLGDPPVLTAELEDYEQEFIERIQVGIDGSHKERGLEAARQALSEPRISDVNAGFMRSEAVLSIIFVSDENDCSDGGALPDDATDADCYDMFDLMVPTSEYVEAFREMKDDRSMVMASAIVGPKDLEQCQDAVPGTRYTSVANDLGGVTGNICLDDFSNIMDEMGLSVSGKRARFQLEYTPVLNENFRVWVGEDEDDESSLDEIFEDELSGWTFDSDSGYLIFHGDALPERGTVIVVEYEIASV